METDGFAMCSKAEVKFRRKNNLLHPLEKDFGIRMVKEYTRSAAGQDKLASSTLRSPAILLKTVDYLLDVFADERLPFGLRYSFVSDRFRAIRQELRQSRAEGAIAMEMMEKQLLFYFPAEYRARREESVAFQAKMHVTAVEECFYIWRALRVGLNQSEEPSALRSGIAVADCLRRVEDAVSLPLLISYRPLILPSTFPVAFSLIMAVRSGNFVRAFRLLRSLPSQISRLSLLPSIANLRHRSLKVIAAAYRSPPVRIPVEIVACWLGYEGRVDSLLASLSEFGCSVEDGKIIPFKTNVTDVDCCETGRFCWVDLGCDLDE